MPETAARSPEEALPTAELVAEIRSLIQEIRRLRDGLQALRPALAESRSRKGSRTRNGSQREESSRARRGLPRTPPEDAPTGPLVEYLRQREVVVYEGQEDLTANEAFEHLARHIGNHFSAVGGFYEKLKKVVATGRLARIDVENMPDRERSAAVQLGNLLHRHGLLKDFYYHRTPRRLVRVIPTEDGTTAQFLTGGWLEIYVSIVLTRRLKSRLSPSRFQVLFNVKGTLPDGREFESDIMAWVDGKLLWIECKTGNWQDYASRFKGLVRIFGTDRRSAGLLLIRPPDPSTRARATDMLDMTLLTLDEVEPFVNAFLEHVGVDEASGLEEPAEPVEPARKLGRVPLPGSGGDARSEAGSSRESREGGRRRRSGARKREETEPADQAAQDLPPAESASPGEPGKPEKPEDGAGQATPAAGEGGEATGTSRRRRRRRRRPLRGLGPEEAGEAGPPPMAGATPTPAPAPSETEEAQEPAGAAPSPVRNRRRRRSPFAREGDAAPPPAPEPVAVEKPEASEEPEDARESREERAPQPEAPRQEQPEVKPGKDEKKPPVEPIRSPTTGVTIAPDLSAMVVAPPEEED